MYCIQRHEPIPFSIRSTGIPMRTELPWRWKDVYLSEDIDDLRPYLKKGYRLINRDNLQVIEVGKTAAE